MVKRPYFLQYIDIRSYFLEYTASIEQGEESIHPLYLTRGGEYPSLVFNKGGEYPPPVLNKVRRISIPSIEQGEENIHPLY